MPNNHHNLLNDFRAALHRLHSQVLESLRYQHEIEIKQPVNAYAWFHILTQDSKYHWIKPLNELVMDVDILLENKNADEEDLKIIRIEADLLLDLDPKNTQSAFAEKLHQLIKSDTDLLLNFHRYKHARDVLPNDKNLTEDARQLRRQKWRTENQINSRALAKQQKSDN